MASSNEVKEALCSAKRLDTLQNSSETMDFPSSKGDAKLLLHVAIDSKRRHFFFYVLTKKCINCYTFECSKIKGL
jgi:hypothetical protein